MSQLINPLENQVILSHLIKFITKTEDLQNIRLTSRQLFELSLIQWRKEATLRLFSYQPASSPNLYLNGKFIKKMGCYDALFPSTTSKTDALPSLLEKHPFTRFHLINFTDKSLPPQPEDTFGQIFWNKYGKSIKFLQISPGNALYFTLLAHGIINTLLFYCDNLEQLQIGPASRHCSDTNDEENIHINEAPLNISLRKLATDSINTEVDAIERTTIEKLQELTLFPYSKCPHRALFYGDLSIMKKLIHISPNLKKVKFVFATHLEKSNLLRALKTHKIKLESLEFESPQQPWMEHNLLLEYLESVGVPLTNWKDSISLPHWECFLPKLFKLLEGTLETLELNVSVRQGAENILSMPIDLNLKLSQLTSLTLNIEYKLRENLPIFHLSSLQFMPQLKKFFLNWEMGCFMGKMLKTNCADLHDKWNKEIKILGESEDMINLQFLTELHLKVSLNAESLQLFSSWAKHLKFMEIILNQNLSHLPKQLWPTLENFTNLSENI